MSDQATQMGLQKSRRIHSQVPRKALYGELKPHLGEVFHRLARQKESRIEQGHLMPDHVHMMISIPPKYAVSQVVGYIKGKSAILLARTKALSLLMVDDRRPYDRAIAVRLSPASRRRLELALVLRQVGRAKTGRLLSRAK
jgi:Transposase IS200 like